MAATSPSLESMMPAVRQPRVAVPSSVIREVPVVGKVDGPDARLPLTLRALASDVERLSNMVKRTGRTKQALLDLALATLLDANPDMTRPIE